MYSTIELMPSRDLNGAPYFQWSDEDLLLEYRATGDRGAFRELVGRYEVEVFNYLTHYLGNAEWAEDVFQTTFLQVHLKCEQFEEGRRVRPWLYTIATNQAIDFQRRNKRHRMVSLDQVCGGSNGDGACLTEMMAEDGPGPRDSLETVEQHELVRAAVESLPENLRATLVLVFYQGLKYREAAEILEIPVGTVKSRVHAALKKLDHVLTLQGLSPNRWN